MMVLTKNWPHGYTIQLGEDGEPRPFTVVSWDKPGNRAIYGHDEHGQVYEFNYEDQQGRDGSMYLRNAPEPKREPDRGVDWVVRWREQISHTEDLTQYAAYETQDAAKERAARLEKAWNASRIAIKRVTWTEGDTE